MPTLGQILKDAREEKGVTASQAAAATNLKMQHVEAMERDDFSRVAAPIYAKGFIKLYADYLGLNPDPLIQEYMELHAPKERPPLMADDDGPSAPGPKRPSFWKSINWAGLREFLVNRRKPIAIGAGIVLALILVFSVSRCSVKRTKEVETAVETPPPAKERPAMPVILNPPEPYVEDNILSSEKK